LYPQAWAGVALHHSSKKCLLAETELVEDAYPERQHSAGFLLSEVQMKILIAAAMFSALAFSPASAAMMACTSDNMTKSTMTMNMMSPGQNAGNKEMAMANADMSNGKMRSACMHYMKAQKMSMAK
jgi:hypothetical protein